MLLLMLAWICTDYTYTKRLVSVRSETTVVLRGKFMGYTEIVLTNGEVIAPKRLTYVNQRPIVTEVVR